MCGIAGRIMQGVGAVGRDLVDLMDAQSHRGADSTGFAIYGAPRDTGYVLRGMGFNKAQMDGDVADLRMFYAIMAAISCQSRKSCLTRISITVFAWRSKTPLI